MTVYSWQYIYINVLKSSPPFKQLMLDLDDLQFEVQWHEL